ncbi:MAG: class I SAM-dependent methyltransferase [Archaeoglobaceae archaeon]
MSIENPGAIEGFFIDLTNNRLASPLYKKYVDSLHFKGDERLLDFGCGGGTLTGHVARKLENGQVIGVDTSEYWIEKARKRLKGLHNVELKQGNIIDMDINNFDVIFIHFVLHEIEGGGKQRLATAKSLAEKLKPEGKIIIREPTKASHGMSSSEITALMNKAGLREIRGESQKSMFLGPMYFGIFEK